MDSNINALLALRRVAAGAAQAADAEEALWTVTRALPSLFAVPADSAPDGPAPKLMAATAFLLTPDKRFHLIAAPVNFAPEQHHEKVGIDLGHPGVIARTRQSLLLRDTSHHSSFVKILQTFRAGSAMFAPMTWADEYVGCVICASAIPNTFNESDLLVHEAFAALASALFLAHRGPEWLAGLDLGSLPERLAGS